jgi:hypothetical protein
MVGIKGQHSGFGIPRVHKYYPLRVPRNPLQNECYSATVRNIHRRAGYCVEGMGDSGCLLSYTVLPNTFIYASSVVSYFQYT